MKYETCSICGEETACHDIKPVTYTYKGHDFIIDQPATWCHSCGEGIIGPKDNKAVQAEIQAHKSKIDGILSPLEVQQIRKQLRLTQKEAGALFGGGVNAFNRYEKGINPIPKPLSLLLIILKRHPEQLREILTY
ncbi:type II toxin-antitoxin system MqsA family antitoxin [Legionella cincinnatiensis]|uniref:Antitoxin MqsA n=1 Tax=Legionella cincinnatiensis TaxID=28085 RepID=A0A378IS01_9GAMM|nr:type II toxin-antitoxin system MqsA family antitoxin [Legionella cincinnatiensis]KTC81954.1 Antitoxin MqsA [Legionella cincinnatiensis]STX34734.1 Antitoxin MqsA [Legionella cincinnatiensis]